MLLTPDDDDRAAPLEGLSSRGMSPNDRSPQKPSPSKQRKMAARRRARIRRRLLIAISAVVVAGVAGTAYIVMQSSPNEEGSLVAQEGECLTSTSTDLTAKPSVTIPAEAPPTALRSCDLVTGTGAEATPGSNVTVQYVGISWSTGKQFDASWDSGRPFDFPLGQGSVIKGWDQGVAGMKVGGRRELVIPPDLGYGERGAGADIKPNETLVFIVDLLKVG